MKRWRRVVGTMMATCMTAAMFGAIPASAAEYDAMNPPIAEVEQGKLRGYMDEETYAFLGVPYATVPERFAMPEEVEPWEGVRDAQDMDLFARFRFRTQ